MSNKIPTEQEIRKAAEWEAALHFSPIYSKDANTACKSNFIAGAKWAMDFIAETPKPKKEITEVRGQYGMEPQY